MLPLGLAGLRPSVGGVCRFCCPSLLGVLLGVARLFGLGVSLMSLLLGVTGFCPAAVRGGACTLGSTSPVTLVHGPLSIVAVRVFEAGLGPALRSFCYALLAATLSAWLPAGPVNLVAVVGLCLGSLGCGGMFRTFHHQVV